MGELLPQLKDIAVPERQVLGWFQPEDSSLFQPDVFPIIILIVDEGFFYATPVWGTPGLKIGLYHHRGERGPADSLSRETGPADEAALRVAAERYFTGSGGPLLAAKTCMFTNTPDGDFIIDTLPGENDVIVASPCSGHGFKFASAIGEILADLARDGQTSADISRFSLARFAAEAAAE
jgi:sarcosine oxidase